jgi:hypothetical protein
MSIPHSPMLKSDYLTMLNDDNLSEIAKYLSTYNIICLSISDKRMQVSIIGKTVIKRVKEKGRFHMIDYINNFLIESIKVYFMQEMLNMAGYDWKMGPSIYTSVNECCY